MKKILLLSELFVPPYDEGMKVTALNLLKGIRNHADCIGLGPYDGENDLIRSTRIKKYLYSRNLQEKINHYSPDFIFYIPEASATLSSFIRYRILRFISNGAGIAMIALQNREYSLIARKVMMLINPGPIFVLSLRMSDVFKKAGIANYLLSVGVDTDKFIPIAGKRKMELREKYNIPKEKYIILHVGHIRESRNIKTFLKLQNQPGIQVLLIGSTSTPQDEELKNELLQAGILIIDKYVPDNHELYQLADCYVFPVIGRTGAMEFPLSVLEAMSCNLPVITTPFGRLPELFEPSADFMYFNTPVELIQRIKDIKQVYPETRKKAEMFSWSNVAKMLLQTCGV